MQFHVIIVVLSLINSVKSRISQGSLFWLVLIRHKNDSEVLDVCSVSFLAAI